MSQRLKGSAVTLAVAVPCLVMGCGQGPPEPPAETRTAPVAAQPDRAAHRLGAEAIERQLAPMLSRSSVDLVAKASPRGGAVVDLAGRFQHLAIARQKADGTIDRSCVTTPEELSALLRSASEAP